MWRPLSRAYREIIAGPTAGGACGGQQTDLRRRSMGDRTPLTDQAGPSWMRIFLKLRHRRRNAAMFDAFGRTQQMEPKRATSSESP
jgi:hypothetical protein